MSLTYADKLYYSNIIRTKFSEIKDMKSKLISDLENENEENYKYSVNIIYSKFSVIERTIVNLKNVFIESLGDSNA